MYKVSLCLMLDVNLVQLSNIRSNNTATENTMTCDSYSNRPREITIVKGHAGT